MAPLSESLCVAGLCISWIVVYIRYLGWIMCFVPLRRTMNSELDSVEISKGNSRRRDGTAPSLFGMTKRGPPTFEPYQVAFFCCGFTAFGLSPPLARHLPASQKNFPALPHPHHHLICLSFISPGRARISITTVGIPATKGHPGWQTLHLRMMHDCCHDSVINIGQRKACAFSNAARA